MNFVAAHGHRWKHVRKSTVAAFSNENVKLMVQVVDQVMDTWIKEVLGDASMDRGVNIDILSEMNKITSNVICQAAFDYNIDNKERQNFLSDLEVCWIEFGQNAGKNPLRKNRFAKWAFQGVRDGHRAATRLHSHCTKMLQEYRAGLPDGAQPHKLIHMINEDVDYANDHERVSDMLAFVIAGFDTTANTLAFCFRELARNQEEQIKLRESIRRCHTPKEARVAVKGVTREIMRLYPAAAIGSVRVLGKDIPTGRSTKGNEVLPKGSLVVTSYYAIQRDPNIFGKDADEFVPIRWEKPTAEQTAAFLTFSAGARNCLGQSLALAEMTEVVARLCRDFQFDVVKAGQAENLVLFKPIGTLLKATQVP